MKGIIVTFSPDGAVNFEAVGFTGPDCVKETKVALGQTKTRKLKARYYNKTIGSTEERTNSK